MNVLLIGNGAREHVIAEALNRSPQRPRIFAYMSTNNPGIVAFAHSTVIGKYDDLDRIKHFAELAKPEFAFIGPEAPLGYGVADILEDMGVPCVGPRKQLAQLETSKAFARELLAKHNIPGNPKFKVFTEEAGINTFLEELGDFVVKADGLHGGKGVKVGGEHLDSVEEAVTFAKESLATDGKVVIEEKLVGEEFSLMAFVDGTTVRNMPCVQDHKRAYEGDTGPNTGGMGSYSAADHKLPFLTDDDISQAKKINQAVCDAITKEHGSYHGIMYGGFMATKDGVKLIEYNARFGDPEAMNVLPILQTDFVAICQAIVQEKLAGLPIDFRNEATVCKYVVPKGYPDTPVKGEPLEIVGDPEGVNIYYAAVNEENKELYMTGSRAIGVVGMASTLADAEHVAQSGVECIKGNVFSRKDIGTAALIQQRIQHMQELR
ncbi:MAG: phosphoribosylamine--glycine ligase [Candidatus Woesearchaeota archaeon]|nr:phosphoribosylamine--glycine ligase [Candidatus Woesearchaeota archaeon]